jgi:hypothetical protein
LGCASCAWIAVAVFAPVPFGVFALRSIALPSRRVPTLDTPAMAAHCVTACGGVMSTVSASTTAPAANTRLLRGCCTLRRGMPARPTVWGRLGAAGRGERLVVNTYPEPETEKERSPLDYPQVRLPHSWLSTSTKLYSLALFSCDNPHKHFRFIYRVVWL